MAHAAQHTLPREYNQADAFQKQGDFRVEVSFERIVLNALAQAPVHNVVPQIVNAGDAWALRGWALLSLGESLIKTVCAALALAVTYVANKVFGAEWDHDVYEGATAAHFKSFWMSGLMVCSPQEAFNKALTPVSDQDPTIDNVTIGRSSQQYADTDPVWGTVGDFSQATWKEKLGVVGPIVQPVI